MYIADWEFKCKDIYLLKRHSHGQLTLQKYKEQNKTQHSLTPLKPVMILINAIALKESSTGIERHSL